MTVTIEAPAISWTTYDDRCDKCGAEAKVATIKGNLELRWCSHHGNEYGPVLLSDGWEFFNKP